MRNFSKLISSFFVLLCCFILNTSSIQAKTINNSPSNSLCLTKSKTFNTYKKSHPNAKLFSTKTIYSKIIHDDIINKDIIKNFDEKGYLNEIKKENNMIYNQKSISKNSDNDRDKARNFGWIRLTIQLYKESSCKYTLFGFYEWLKVPFWRPKEIMSLCHGDGVTFDYKESVMEFYDHGGDTYHYYEYGSSNYIEDIGGIAFTYSDAILNKVDKPYGTIQAVVNNRNGIRDTEFKFDYAHGGLKAAVGASISIDKNVGLSISPSRSYDHVRICIAPTLN